jgi:hypothetical protein
VRLEPGRRIVSPTGGPSRWQAPPDDLIAKYGTFFIRVHVDHQAARTYQPNTETDSNEIMWRRGSPEVGPRAGEVIASASKLYGNLELVWFPGGSEERVDERWRELDHIMHEL